MTIEIDNKKMWESLLYRGRWSSGTIFDVIEDALKDQGLEYKNGEIVSIEQKQDASELAESEDEKIRKDICTLVTGWRYRVNIKGFASMEDMLAWLEKQGENTYNKELSELLHKVICRFINDPDIPYSDREKVSMKVLPYVERLKKQGERKCGGNVNDEALQKQLQIWFDKGKCSGIDEVRNNPEKYGLQGEQKSIEASDLRTWKYIVDAVLTEREGIGQYIDSPWTTEVAEKLQKRFGNIE